MTIDIDGSKTKSKSESIPHARKLLQTPMGRMEPNNFFSCIFDKFSERLVAIMSMDNNLSINLARRLCAESLLSSMEKKQADRMSCPAIKNKTIVRIVGTFISRGRNPCDSLTKLLNILTQFQELKALSEEISTEAKGNKFEQIIKIIILNIISLVEIKLKDTSDVLQCKIKKEPTWKSQSK